MSQQNYFTYNIIDTLYYNQPTGQDLVKVYGLLGAEGFKRRNATEYDRMTDEQKHNYDEQEKKFIKAVIDRYIFEEITTAQNDNVDHTYIGIYDPSDTENVNNTSNDVTYAFFKTPRKTGIELSDMISNINGTHNYKLISAKDIDFDNVILPNSAISNTFNWGSFDNNRRWGDKPIRINNTFELLNVIDYLLCACDNLWSELYKIKYSTNVGVQIWFSKDVTDVPLINNAKKLVTQDFQIDGGRSIETRMITYLDPFNYYTSMTNNPNHNFGVVTNFYVTDQDGELSFDRKIIDMRRQNIELMVILPKNKIIEDYASTTNQNINGQLQAIYAYKIGDELKFYPGSRIDTFTDENNIIIDSNALVDFKEKKLKNETFFKVDGINAKYNLVYIKFLDVKQLGLDGIEDPYFIYYINNDNKKVILSCNYKNSNVYSSPDIKTQLELKLYGSETYSFYNLDSNLLSDDMIYVDPNTTLRYPKYYVMVDKFHTSLEVSTPNSSNFSSSSQSITIYWYKNTNKLDCTITRKDKSNNDIQIFAEEDTTQRQSLSYHSFRYNVPDGQKIDFKFDSSYIALNNDNPMGLRLDDEYDDIMLYDIQNISNDEVIKYYKYDSVETTGGQFKRIFENFTPETFENNKNNYIATDNHNTQYKHTWVKNENPYRLTLTIDNDEFNNQLSNKEDVISEINLIKNGKFIQTSYNSYQLEHTLTDGIEQIKLDLIFKIEETSKVKAISYTIPLNINKIYYPTINYYSKDAVIYEQGEYSNILYKTVDGTAEISLGNNIHPMMYNKYGTGNNGQLNRIPDIYNLMTGENIQNVEELLLPKTYDCTINNSIFELTYSPTLNLVNILGGWYTEKYVESSAFKSHGFADINLKVNNISKILKDSSTNSSMKPYIFNINGFGRNYRMHGNGQVVSDKWNSSPLLLNNVKEFYDQFDLTSIATLNEIVSINKQLKIKLTDGDEYEDNYQLTNICLQVDDENNGIWDANNMQFNSGLNVITQSDVNMGNENNEDEIYNDYNIRTLPFELYKGTYAVECPIDFDQVSQNSNNITYYVPVTYLYINSSTFFPPLNTKPQGRIYDLNDNTDLTKYNNYVTCWNDNNNYHPVTLSMKLFDNTTITNPYYYESNEAVMKFDVKRVAPITSVTVQGTNNIIYVALGARYYLSDFIRVGSINEDAVIDNNSQIIDNVLPSGSYFYYDDTYKTHVIAEILANFKHNSFSSDHNSHYQYYEGDVTNISNPDFTNQTTNVQTNNVKRIVPYPVFNKEVINLDNSITYSPTTYNYDIYRIADINKVNINAANAFSAQVITISDESSDNISNVNNNDAVGIISNANLCCIDFDLNFINNFADNKASENNTFNIIMYQLNYNGLYGSKNYLGNSGTTAGTKTKIAPIVRKKLTNVEFSTLHMYSTVNYSGADPTGDYSTLNGEYEFFEFKYEDIVEIKLEEKQNPTDPDVWTVKSLAPGTSVINDQIETLDVKDAYDLQLELFLLNDPEDFIANMSFYINYYSSNLNNSVNPQQ